MALVNRDKDASEQRINWHYNTSATIGTGITLPLLVAGCAQQLVSLQIAAFGISNAPILTFQVGRFVVGSGFTMLSTGFSAMTVNNAYGTSGVVGWSAAVVPTTSGSTLVQMLKNDVLFCVTSGANTAGNYVIEVVTQVLQDIKSDYGV